MGTEEEKTCYSLIDGNVHLQQSMSGLVIHMFRLIELNSQILYVSRSEIKCFCHSYHSSIFTKLVWIVLLWAGGISRSSQSCN